tara:strand:- start:29 stop:253 length:225 start_codon:yes stop_codon:yes gene_type:complete
VTSGIEGVLIALLPKATVATKKYCKLNVRGSAKSLSLATLVASLFPRRCKTPALVASGLAHSVQQRLVGVTERV